jgi:hypothetical protein
MNNLRDFNIAHDQHWYHIPVRAVNSMLKEGWPPAWLAFYQTKVFGPDRWAINYYAAVRRIRVVSRRELIPDDRSHNRANVMYHKIEIEPYNAWPDRSSARGGAGSSLFPQRGTSSCRL